MKQKTIQSPPYPFKYQEPNTTFSLQSFLQTRCHVGSAKLVLPFLVLLPVQFVPGDGDKLQVLGTGLAEEWEIKT